MLTLIVSRVSILNIIKVIYIFISFILFDDFKSQNNDNRDKAIKLLKKKTFYVNVLFNLFFQGFFYQSFRDFKTSLALFLKLI